jgi:hypothetical protein
VTSDKKRQYPGRKSGHGEDLEFKNGTLRVLLRKSKTDQEGKGRTIVVLPGRNPKTCPVAAVCACLGAADLAHEGKWRAAGLDVL